MDLAEQRKLALEKLVKLQRELPVDWKFDREAANARNEPIDAPSPELPNPPRHS
jgi:hypothetical protein